MPRCCAVPGDADYASGHAIENNLAMADALGLAPSTHRLALPQIKSESGAKMVSILIHPGASRPNKRWSVKNWTRLADALAEEFGAAIFLTGAESEKTLADEIIGKMKMTASNLAGALSLRQLGAAQAGAVAFLSATRVPIIWRWWSAVPPSRFFAPTDRGSSVEACGPHQADPVFHRAIQTANHGDSITTIPFERVLAEASDVIEKSLVRKGTA